MNSVKMTCQEIMEIALSDGYEGIESCMQAIMSNFYGANGKWASNGIYYRKSENCQDFPPIIELVDADINWSNQFKKVGNKIVDTNKKAVFRIG
jgi:hypothetical protein